ncbi:hypothetical protein D3C74_285860 [compost metagenome]
MARMKFEMWKNRPEYGGIKFAFTDGKGDRRVHSFGSPPESIDHVSPMYLYDRFSNAKNVRHCNFIKRRYKEEIVNFRELL